MMPMRHSDSVRSPILKLVVNIGVAKTHKYAARESGDTVETVERPNGGISVLLVDGQGSGAPAKGLSSLLTARGAGLVKEGVRDGAVARALNDLLFTLRGGKVSAALDIVSVDLKHSTLVLTRNGSTTALLCNGPEHTLVPPKEGPLGIYPFTRPSVVQTPLKPELRLIVVSDGVTTAGVRYGHGKPDLRSIVDLSVYSSADPQAAADQVLAAAIALDQGRPADDMTVVVVAIDELAEPSAIRRMSVSLPVS